MPKVHQLPDPDELQREASEWIARLNAEDATPEDRARFEAWRLAHPRHARAYEELAATWNAFVAAGPLVRAVSFGQSMSAAASLRAPRRPWYAAAAVVLAAALLAGGWFWTRLTPQPVFQTAIGEHATISLPDGSTLELNSNSLAREEYSAGARIIRLERGEAYFNVAHDTQRPFWVVGGGSWVRAVGTAFNVDLRSSDVLVTVSEGTVKVSPAEPFPSLTPSDGALARLPVSVVTAGQQIDLRGRTTAVRSLAPDDLTRSVAWRSGTLYFENQPLSEVIDELSRYTSLRLIVEDPKLRDIPVGGTFQASSQGVEALLRMLHDGFGLDLQREDGRVYIVNSEANRAD